MSISEFILGLISGIILTLIGKYIANQIDQRTKRIEKEKETMFYVYMKLLELKSLYHSLAFTKSIENENSNNSRYKMWSLSWEIADKLRECDTIELLDEILDVLFNKTYNSSQQRYDKMNEIISSMKISVNPNYSRSILRITNKNIKLIESGQQGEKYTPGYLI